MKTFRQFLTESKENTDHTNDYEKANEMKHVGHDDYEAGHDFESKHDHAHIVKGYRKHIQNPKGPDRHSRLGKSFDTSYGGAPETEFTSHSSNLETRGHNVVHTIQSEKLPNGNWHHSISQRENNG